MSFTTLGSSRTDLRFRPFVTDASDTISKHARPMACTSKRYALSPAATCSRVIAPTLDMFTPSQSTATTSQAAQRATASSIAGPGPEMTTHWRSRS